MSKRLIKFPSVEQFRNIVANINRSYNFVGLDENGDAIYDETKVKPTLKWISTTKCHGTNFSVVFNEIDGLWAQSREHTINPIHDNAGSAFFAHANDEIFKSLIRKLATTYNIDLTLNNIVLYMEWCGKGIQKGVGIANLDKSAFIFPHAKVAPISPSENEVNYWIPTIVDGENISSKEHRIYNIMDFKTQSIDIDFNNPQLYQNKIIEMTLEVENECPVAKAFGYDNTVGEGLVFHHLTNNGVLYLWKSKGEKHSNSKVKTLKTVDDVKLNRVISVVNQVCSPSRFDQMLTQSCNLMNGGMVERKYLGDFIRLVINDVIKEESDVIAEAGLEPKDLNSKISEVARRFFFDKEKDFIGV